MSGVQFPVEKKNTRKIEQFVKPKRGESPLIEDNNKIINPPTPKPARVSRKETPKYILDYLEKLIECMRTLVSIINENQ